MTDSVITPPSSCLLTHFLLGYQYIHGFNTETYHLSGEEISMKMQLRRCGYFHYQLMATQQKHRTQDCVRWPPLGINTYIHAQTQTLSLEVAGMSPWSIPLLKNVWEYAWRGESKKGREMQDNETARGRQWGHEKALEQRTGGDLQMPWRIHKISAYAHTLFLEVHP